jgi:CRP/FNR family transcriptional regulator, cyclic AMP receptor protein
MEEQERGLVRTAVAREGRDWPSTSFLARLTGPTRQELLDLGDVRQFARGERITREGEPGSEAFLLLSACAKVTAQIDEEQEALLAIRVGGDIVGELALMDGEPRSATVTACRIEPSLAVAVGRDAFTDFLQRSPQASSALAAEVSRRLRWSDRRRVEFSGCSVKVRTARVIVELTSAYGKQLPYNGVSLGTNLSQGELATLIGAAEPSIQKALRELRDAGLIDTGYRMLVVLDLPGLRAMAGLPAAATASF